MIEILMNRSVQYIHIMRQFLQILLISILIFTIPIGAESFVTGGPYTIGDAITVSGITNLNTDNRFLVEIFSASFGPTGKYDTSMTGGGSIIVPVNRSENGTFFWNSTFNSTGWEPDQYMIRVEAIGKDYRETGYVNLTIGNQTETELNSTVPVEDLQRER